MVKNFYITTPIYYPSAIPHMGHAYSSIIADVFARFKSIDDFQVHFLTGTDEHGLKIQRSAEKVEQDPQKFCDQISKTFREYREKLELTDHQINIIKKYRKKYNLKIIFSILDIKSYIYFRIL